MKKQTNLLSCIALGLTLVACSGDDKGDTSKVIDNSMVPDAGGGGAADDAGRTGQDPGAQNAGGNDIDAGTAGNLPCGGACPAGQMCDVASNLCKPIVKACPCAAGNHCDATSNTCAPGCVLDKDCAPGSTCTAATGVCAAPGPCDGTLVPGLTISKVAVNQAVEIPLFQSGKAVGVTERPAPIVQNRKALFRISVTPAAGYVPGEVITQLALDNDGLKQTFEAKGVISMGSNESTLEGTVNISVGAELIGSNTQLSIALTQKTCAATPGTGRFPASGTVALSAIKTGRFKVVIVPYERAPGKLNLNDQTVQTFKDHLYAFYPTEGIDVEVHAAIPVTSAQTDLQAVLQNVRALRARENPASDTYYFGMFTAAASFREFCGNGCVAGIATLGSSAAERYGVGIGYLTDTATTSSGVPTTEIDVTLNVVAHELGHAQGRQHAPCGGPAGIDRNFPNRTADIDTYGYNVVTGAFAQPKVAKDIMAYCEPNWISAYTYRALATRIQSVNMNKRELTRQPREYASVIVEPDGRYIWGENVMLRDDPSGRPAFAKAYDATDTLLDDEVAITLTDLADYDGLLVTLPVPKSNWAWLEIAGQHVPVQ